MSAQDDTLEQLNLARHQLDTFIIGTTAKPNTPQWTALQKVIDKRVELTIQINDVISAGFVKPTGADVNAAIANLQQCTQHLTDLEKTLGKADLIIADVDNVVQAATAILTLVVA